MKKWIFTFILVQLTLSTQNVSAAKIDCFDHLQCSSDYYNNINDGSGSPFNLYNRCLVGTDGLPYCIKQPGANEVNPYNGAPPTAAEAQRQSETKTTTGNQRAQVNNPLCGVDNKGVSTAFGCLMAGDPPKMISQLLGWGAIVGAGIAFLMIIGAGIQIVLAGGDPKKIQAARELITSAIAGLLLIVFSVLLLNFIGVKILGLNNFGFGQ